MIIMGFKESRSCQRVLALAFGAFFFASSVQAAKWERDLVVAPSLIYTDNVCLTKDDKRSDWTGVALLTPSGTVSVETSRTKARLQGSVTVNTLSDGDLRDDGCTGDSLDDRQKYFPRLLGTMNTILIEDWVKLNVSARADQNRVSSARASSNDGLDRNGNTNTFYRYEISPSTSRKIGSNTKADLRYTYSEVLNSEDSVSDSSRHAVVSSVKGDFNSRMTWDVKGRYSNTSYNDDAVNVFTGESVPREDTELKSLSGKLGYQLTRTLQVNGTYGWEWNDFQTFQGRDTGGQAWDVGLRWAPSPRTLVDVGIGDRFFGTTPRVRIRHERQRSTITANYEKVITFQRDLATYGINDPAEGLGTFSDGDPLFSGGSDRFDADGDAIDGIGTDTSMNSDGVIIDERLTLTYVYKGRVGTLQMFGSYSQQTREEDGQEADFTDWEISFSPTMSGRYNLVGSVYYEDVKPAGFTTGQDFSNQAESEQWTYRLNLTYRMSDRMNLTFGYRFVDRQSDLRLNEYKENLFQIGFRLFL